MKGEIMYTTFFKLYILSVRVHAAVCDCVVCVTMHVHRFLNMCASVQSRMSRL